VIPHTAFGFPSLLLRTHLVAAVLLISAPVLAQTSRVEAIAAQQADKAQRLEPERAGTAERVVVRVLSSSLLAATDGVHPWFGSVYPGAGFSGGVGYLKQYPNRTRLVLVGATSVRGSTGLDARFSGPTFARGTLTPRVSASHVRVKGLSFFGTGPDSIEAARSRFDFTPSTAGGGLTFAPRSWLTFDGEYQAVQFGTRGTDSPLLPLAVAPAFGQDLRYHVPRASAAADWRPSPRYATRGGLLRASVARYEERRGEPFDFREVELEAVQLVPLVREQFVLAFRGLATFTDTDPGHVVPFALLPTVGSGSTVRGYANRRFADENRLVLTGEYRWRPSRYLDMAVFLDAGQVAPHRHELAVDRLKTAWGIGARLHGPAFSALRLDVARSREGISVVIATGPPF
jgi:hypothetical protein